MPIYCPPPSPDEIYHHGILGQKWGKRNGPPYPLGASDKSYLENKYERQKASVKNLQQKRREVAQTKGITSDKYSKVSKKLYLERERTKYTKAKIDKDDVAKVNAKAGIKDAKYFKKNGLAYANAAEYRKIMGSNLSNKEMEALRNTEWNKQVKKDKTKRAVDTGKRIAIVATPILVTAGAAYYNKNSDKIAYNLARKNKEQYITTINKGVKTVNNIIQFTSAFTGG